MTIVESFNTFQQLGAVRLVANTNQTATYYNGRLGNGIGATLTYGVGVVTIDSTTVQLNDFVLIVAQTDASQNGIYQCTSEGTAGTQCVLTRRSDFQSIAQISAGQYIPVTNGTTYAGSIWAVKEPLPQSIGITSATNLNDINISQVGSSGGVTVTPADIQNQTYTYAVDTGAADAYVVTLSPAPTAYTDGMYIAFKATNANTGAATINANSLGVISLVTNANAALSANAILAGGDYIAMYNSTFGAAVLINPAVAAVTNPWTAGTGASSAFGGIFSSANGNFSLAYGNHCSAAGANSQAFGLFCAATGNGSMAIGRGSVANNDGSFVWNDASGNTVTDTGTNQWVTRAIGGYTWNVNPTFGMSLSPNGQLNLFSAGAGLTIKSGGNCKIGTAVLVGGTVTVSNTSVTANSLILLTVQVAGGTQGNLSIGTVVAGTSFDINSDSALDTSTVGYMIVEKG